MTIYTTSALYTPKLLAKHRSKVFLFGDNLLGVGKGGQAVVREMENACGIPTKKAPRNDRDAFFYDDDLPSFIGEVVACLEWVKTLAKHRDIVVPVTSLGQISLGLGLANLPKHAPFTYELICAYIHALAREHGGFQTL